MGWEDRPELAIRCIGCREIHVGVELEDGDLMIVGNSQQCRNCGNDEFRPVDLSLLEEDTESRGTS